MPILFRSLLSLSMVLSLHSLAHATIIDGSVTTGGGVFVKLSVPFGIPSNPTNSVGNDTFQSPDLYGFDEGKYIVLNAPLNVDDIGNGSPGILPAGTVVASHYVFFDPVNASQVGFVEFDSDILAVISSTTNLGNSDFLLNNGVNYLNPTLRGLETGDSVSITGPRRIDVDWMAGTPGDYVRVLTTFSPAAVVPEPASVMIWLLLIVTSLFGCHAMRRSRMPAAAAPIC